MVEKRIIELDMNYTKVLSSELGVLRQRAAERDEMEQRVKELEAGYDAAGVKNVMEWRNRLQARAAQFPVMLDALRIVMEDFVESEGCYCGQIVGGTDEQGLPKGVCGTCKGCAAIQAAEAVERSK